MSPAPTPARGARLLRPAGLLAPLLPATLVFAIAFGVTAFGVTAFGAIAFGCATNKPEPDEPCTRAVDKLENECGFVVEGADTGVELNCTGSAACAADCLYEASCADIKNNAPGFTDCLNGCQK